MRPRRGRTPPRAAARRPRRGRRRVGVFLVGACGNVATCVVAGTAAIVRGAMDRTGLVTETPLCAGLPLVPLEDLVFGGWEIRDTDLTAAAREFGERNGLLTPELRREVAGDLRRASRELRTGLGAAREPLGAAFARLQDELRRFREKHRLDEVVVVNVASTEPVPAAAPGLRSLADFRRAVVKGERAAVPTSVVYAVAALDAGFPFVDFTPSVACDTAPVRESAAASRVPFCGRDGKTGETLLKTVLAPMFVARHLPVLSWEGFNMLGNRDGETLREAGALAAKVRDKDDALRRILHDETTHTRVRIDYVPSLDDWKQAYDFVHFRGFLGARMQLHFLWQGCDSALAAPLVLDLVRLTDLARRRGEHGALPWLAAFFKTPVGSAEREFAAQMRLLSEWCEEARGG